VGSMPCLVVTLGPRGLESMPLLQCRAGCLCSQLSSRCRRWANRVDMGWVLFFCRISGWTTAHPALAPPLVPRHCPSMLTAVKSVSENNFDQLLPNQKLVAKRHTAKSSKYYHHSYGGDDVSYRTKLTPLPTSTYGTSRATFPMPLLRLRRENSAAQ
jgi:hypothetical protein